MLFRSICGSEHERAAPPAEDSGASFRKDSKSKRSIEFTGDLEEDVEMLEKMENEVLEKECQAGGITPSRIQPSPAAATHPALQALDAGRQKSGVGVKIPSLKLPPRPGSVVGQEERSLQPRTVSEGGPPAPAKLKFTGDLEEDVAMLEELEEIGRAHV